jgi:hypothetical protein
LFIDAGRPWQDVLVSSLDLVLVLRYRKAVTYGFHVLLGALQQHETATAYEVVFAESAEATIASISSALPRAKRSPKAAGSSTN